MRQLAAVMSVFAATLLLACGSLSTAVLDAASGAVPDGWPLPASSSAVSLMSELWPWAAELAWAAPNSNEEPVTTGVPTDDTGMVDETQKNQPSKEDNENQSVAEKPLDPNASSSASDQNAPGSPSETGVPDEPDASSDTDELKAPDDSATDSSSSEKAPVKKPKTVVPDVVFPNAKDASNLVNPQQKPDSSFIYDTSINDLQSADSYLNDQTVQITGEVVGDRLWAEFDPGYCWVVLQSNDGNYAEVPIFLSEELTNLIDTYGSYGRKGTTLQIRGTFHLACPQHEGLTDLHADNVSVVAKGTVMDRTLNPSTFVPGAALVGAGLLLMLVFHQMREGQR